MAYKKHSNKPEPKTPPLKAAPVEVEARHIWKIIGMLMVQEERHLNRRDLATMTGIPLTTLSNIMNGYRKGGVTTIKRLLTLRERGLMIHLSDFETKQLPSSQESVQTFES